MARHLVQIAWEAGSVRRVLAHTLPEINASGRVLEIRFRLGDFEDEADDENEEEPVHGPNPRAKAVGGSATHLPVVIRQECGRFKRGFF